MAYGAPMIRVRERRTAAGISQRELAEMSGVGVKTIRRIEADASYATTVHNAARIAQALGTTIDDLIHEVDSATRRDGRGEISDGPAPAKTRAAANSVGG